jgi:hypothetical protein
MYATVGASQRAMSRLKRFREQLISFQCQSQ